MTYHKVFVAHLGYLYDMLAFIKKYPSFKYLSPSISDQIILATEEALVNIIKYGYPQAEKGTIKIACEDVPNHAGLKITIQDQGIPFNPIKNVPSSPPSPTTLDTSEDIIGGYGIYIFIGIMDHVEYQRIKRGNILSLIKYF